ncbi:maker130 [Drosophila busckii]|uniref:Maker128 n=2 Tax=Drosophila busckii TaxID=30019 RepID=A0A0M4ELR5_DROBS|nr:maker128 [Drosophila busckii]ALC42570.1 maker130 [Drosophila busckii]
MQLSFIALACCLVACTMAYPHPEDKPKLNWNPPTPDPRQQQRWMLDGGYNKDQTGHDVHVQGQAPVWTSNNGRHEVDVAAQYGQHLGGPYGNSRPSYGGAGIYRFRF